MPQISTIIGLIGVGFSAFAAPAKAADANVISDLVYAGVAGAKVIDAGAIVVTGGGAFDRTETFEYVRRPDGGITLLNVITATDGAFRVAARFDLDEAWQSQRAVGQGLYNGKPVDLQMQKNGKRVDISISNNGSVTSAEATCDPSCFINMSPSITAMFVMTHHYDLQKKGVQVFQWAGQDLDRVRTLSGGKARLQFDQDQAITRKNGDTLTLRHFTFVEELPGPNGSTFKLDFDLWTDTDARPFGFRVKAANSKGAGLIGFRQGYEDVKAVLHPTGQVVPDAK
ncbi:MAG: hypothetical protein JNM81_13175 [Rhodospirillaceae bacterium]|nr:hypothetical protein [Rhodospirillaceae bacterium]